MNKLLFGASLAIGTVVLAAGSAGATADEHASCPGIAFSEHGPAGEVQGEITAGRAFAETVGVPFGSLVKLAARSHLGTHAACGG